MNTLKIYAIEDEKEVQNTTTSYDESSDKIKEELSQNGNVVTQYTNEEDGKIKTILWTKGINPPKMGGTDSEFSKEITNVNGEVAYIEYKAPYSAGKGWYDVNKTENRVPDLNLCFAAAASNALHWWLEQNSNYIDQYLAKNPDYPKSEELANLRDSFKSQQDSEVYKLFLRQFAYKEEGYWSDILADQFINGYYPKPGGGTNDSDRDRETLLTKGPDPKGGFFYDVFGTTLLTQRRNYSLSYNTFGNDLKKLFLEGNIVIMDYNMGRISHAVTLWGAEFDLNGQISAVYLSDSDDDKSQGMVRYMVRNSGGKPVISTHVSGKGSVIENLEILSPGKEIWEEKLNISKKPLNLVWGDVDFTYNGKMQKPIVTATNIASGDDVIVSVKGEQINAGTYTATAVLSGSSANKYKLPTEHTKTFIIKKAQAKINLSSNPQYNKNSNTVILKANVSGLSGEKPDGRITFKDGDKVIASNINVSGGEASYYWTNPIVGNHSIIAEFSPSTDGIGKNYTNSTSDALSVDVTVQPNNAPKINGADNITIKVGQVKGFNLLDGITVTDDRDKNLIPTVSGRIGKPSPGTNKDYTIIYTAKDTDGNTTTVTRVITVTNQLPIIEGLNDITINKGESADLKKGVTAKDNEDGILTDKIVFPTINLSTLSEGKHQVTYKVTDSDGNSRSEKRILNVKKNNSSEDKPSYPSPKPFSSLRLGGIDRYNTAIEIAKKFQNGKMLDNVVIANGLNFPDALTGSALASSLNAPILLTYINYAPKTRTIEYIKSNLKKEGTVYLLGGTGVVPENYVNELKAAGFTKFVRLGGSDRYATNLEIVNKMNVKEGTPIFVANSTAFADSLSASPISAAKGMPIFLSFKDYMPKKTMNAIKKIKPSKIYVVGSNGVISDGLANQLSNIAPVTRLGGPDRYDTCLAINKHFNLDTENAIIASGLDFPDALTGSVLATKLNAPIILLPSWVGEKQKKYIDSTRMRNLYILGGNALITDTMVNELKK